MRERCKMPVRNRLEIGKSGPEPLSELRFRNCAGSDGFHYSNRICRIKTQQAALIREKQAGNHPARPLVTVGERMIAGQAVGITGGKSRCVCVNVSGQVLRSSQGRLQAAEVG